MARPLQLRYDDATDGETVIGTYLTGDNLIQQASLKNSGSGEYTRLEIKGDKQLSDNLPTDNSQYATAEPEILVYVRDSSGNWQLRDRVFAEDAGTLEDDGTYRNANLWGFQKWVGRQKTPNRISLTSVTITDVVDALLPTGYTAVTPTDDTVPTLDSYSFNGKIDRGIRDLVRDFPVKIWFTADTDGSGNYEVKVQSKGYGGVVETVTFDTERKTEGYSIIEFQEEDKANIVNKVEIEGVDSNGNKISEIVEDSTSISNHGERYIHRNVGYLESSTQATNIANDILSPDPSPHAKMSIPFQEQNVLNASIDILDDRFGIDAVYTVVKQRDFFTEGRTEVELGFEKNRSEQRRDRDRELDERNHQLFPSSATQEDVGNQDFTGDTGSAPSDTSATGGVDSAPSDTATTGGVDSDPSDTNITGSLDAITTNSLAGSSDNFNQDEAINISGWDFFGSVSASTDALAHLFVIQVLDISDTRNLEFCITSGSTPLWQHQAYQVGSNPADGISEIDSFANQFMEETYMRSMTGFATGNTLDYNVYVASAGSSTPTVELEVTVIELNHVHPDNYDTEDLNHPHGDNINTDDFDHPHGDNLDTDDFSHGGTSDATGQHGASGTTDPKSVDIESTQEDKTDR